MKNDRNTVEAAAYGLIETCSAEQAENNAVTHIAEMEDNAKRHQDEPFHKSFLVFLKMAKETLDDKRIPTSDLDKAATGMCQLLSMYDRLKNLDAETLHYVTNYGLAIHYTAWLYWETRRRQYNQELRSRTKWHAHAYERAIELHAEHPAWSAADIARKIITTKPAGLKLPKFSDVYDYVRTVFATHRWWEK